MRRTLEFVVEGQRLKKKPGCEFGGIVAGSVGYLRAVFYFSSEWDNCVKAASFWENGQEHSVLLDANDSCIIPDEAVVGNHFLVSVTGAKAGFKIKSTKVKVRQEV